MTRLGRTGILALAEAEARLATAERLNQRDKFGREACRYASGESGWVQHAYIDGVCVDCGRSEGSFRLTTST